ncbi:hypothetical protein EJ08DRAFT_39920 [Tothia fuscella]|uniref:Uncharacterized protein n=1 Tax=Tothia fuscella TaxID=1048955 RepID=A0A9P4U0P0_9PEZI|nr:hypothetical protein EJ08DRAFT_39920 [Tothia fuscella]
MSLTLIISTNPQRTTSVTELNDLACQAPPSPPRTFPFWNHSDELEDLAPHPTKPYSSSCELGPQADSHVSAAPVVVVEQDRQLSLQNRNESFEILLPVRPSLQVLDCGFEGSDCLARDVLYQRGAGD